MGAKRELLCRSRNANNLNKINKLSKKKKKEVQEGWRRHWNPNLRNPVLYVHDVHRKSKRHLGRKINLTNIKQKRKKKEEKEIHEVVKRRAQ